MPLNSPTSSTRSTNLQVVDLLRTAAILPVVALHFANSGNAERTGTGWANELFRAFERNGSYGVSIFFVISGFLITRMVAISDGSLFEVDLRRFYVRRIGRIWPLLFLTTALGVGVIFLAPADGAKGYCFREANGLFDVTFWVSIFTFSFNWVRMARADRSGSYGTHWDVQWSLAVEEQFYLLYPLALRWLKTERRLVRFLGAVIVLGTVVRVACMRVRPDHFLLVFTNSFSCFDMLAIGCLLHLAHEKARGFFEENQAWAALTCAAGALVAGTVYFGMWLQDLVTRNYGSPVLGIGVFLFLLGGLSLRLFESKLWLPLAIPGKLSFGCYLFHASAMYLLWPYLKSQNFYWSFLLLMTVTVVIAAISFYLFETPVNRWVRARFGGSPAR